MPDPNSTDRTDGAGADEHLEPGVSDAVATTEAYETDEGVVFYDAENPLAWIQATEAVALTEAA